MCFCDAVINYYNLCLFLFIEQICICSAIDIITFHTAFDFYRCYVTLSENNNKIGTSLPEIIDG